MKFAFVAQGLPPVWLGRTAMFSSQIGKDGQMAQGRRIWLGQTAVYYRLLHGLNPDDYCLITQDYGDVSSQAYQAQSESHGKYYILPSWLQFKRGWRFGAVRWANITLRALEIARIVRREKCAAVVACTSDIFDLPAAYLASRMTRTRFYPYFFDYYSHMSAGYESSAFAHRFEPRMVKAAAGVIVTNAFMRDELRRRYGVEAKVIHNPCDLSGYEFTQGEDTDATIGKSGEIKIIYTGSIYEAHYSAFRNLIASIKLLKDWNVKLHIYTTQTSVELEKHGICGPVTLFPPQSASMMPEIQRGADLLFFPLSFTSPYPEIVRTSAPGKTGEYLAAGRPVLVHAPPDSFLAWYFRRYECGMVVDECDSVKLASAIETLLTDASLRHKLVVNARERAQADFSISASQTAFMELMELNTPAIKREQPSVKCEEAS